MDFTARHRTPTSPPTVVRRRAILIVEDDPPFSRAVAAAVAVEGFEPLVAHTALEARKVLAAARLAGATIDIDLPDGNGLDLMPEIHARYPGIPLLVLTNHDTRENLQRATASRAPLLPKQGFERDLAAWANDVRTHRATAEAVFVVVNDFARAHDLSDRQRDILRLAVTGLDRKEIAAALGLHEGTVIEQRVRIKERVGRNFAGIVADLQAELMGGARGGGGGDRRKGAD